LKNASCLRAWSLVRSLRRSNCVESEDSTPFSLLDLEPDPKPSATEPFFNRLLGGEWGHTALPRRRDDEPCLPCYCGHSGCVETLLSGPGLALDHARRMGDAQVRWTAAEIAAAAEAGDARAIESMQRYAERLARALSTIVNVLDPDVIVLGGGLSQVDSLYRDVPALLQRSVFASVGADPLRVDLRRSVHGDSSGVRGAAWLWRTAGLSPSSA
jgi:fructokinase